MQAQRKKGRPAFIHKVTELLENTTAAWKRRRAQSRTRPLPAQEGGGSKSRALYRNVCIHAPYITAYKYIAITEVYCILKGLKINCNAHLMIIKHLRSVQIPLQILHIAQNRVIPLETSHFKRKWACWGKRWRILAFE